MNNNIEEGDKLDIDFSKLKSVATIDSNVIPVIVQDANTKEVLMMAYVNEEALKYTIEKKIAVFWSTSRNELWIKGKDSGQYLDLLEIRVNCEQNSLLYIVKLRDTGACHTKNNFGQFRYSCYYRKVDTNNLTFI